MVRTAALIAAIALAGCDAGPEQPKPNATAARETIPSVSESYMTSRLRANGVMKMGRTSAPMGYPPDIARKEIAAANLPCTGKIEAMRLLTNGQISASCASGERYHVFRLGGRLKAVTCAKALEYGQTIC